MTTPSRSPAAGVAPPARADATRAGIDRRPAVLRGLEVVFREGPLARRQLRAALGSSPSTATEVVHVLLARGLIVETGTTAPTGGRPAKVLDISSALGVVLAADIGATNTRVAAGSLRGEMLAHRTVATPATADPKPLQRILVEAMAAVHRDAGGGRVRAMAIGLAGIIDRRDSSIVDTTVPGWESMAAGKLLSWMQRTFTGHPLLIENEANLAALGEHVRGVARGAADVLFVAVGAGVGAGLVIDGLVFRGFRGAAGEIGYTRLPAGGGVVELDRLGGAEALVRRYRDAGGTAAVSTAEAIFERAASADAAASTAINEVVEDLAISIANAIALLDPERVVIGGGLAEAGDAFLQPLRARVRELSLVPAPPELMRSELGADAALIGGICLACEHAREAIARELELTG